METLVLYHEDNDGFCSAAIVNKYFDVFKLEEKNRVFYPIDYHKVDKFFEWFEKQEDFDKIIIVDFSFGKDWKRLLETVPLERIIWIDHHGNAIENGFGTDILKSQGLRKSDNAGCVLTWKYFFSGFEIPWVVKLVEDYDIWKFEFGDDTKAFLYGSLAEGDRISNPQSYCWKLLLEETSECYGVLLRQIIRDGHCILKYVKESHKEKCKEMGYISNVSFPGVRDLYRCVVCNNGRGSAIFDSVTDDYDMMVIFWFDGEYYNYSFYSKGEDAVDVSKIARYYGGNGHVNAAGCRSKEMLFPKHAEVRW